MAGVANKLKKAKPVPVSEDQECYWLVEHLDKLREQGRITMFSHIANETYIKSWAVRVKQKKLGKTAGVPDYLILAPTKALAIEMKTRKGGYPTLEQKAWIEALQAAGIAAKVCRGCSEAKVFIEEELRKTP